MNHVRKDSAQLIKELKMLRTLVNSLPDLYFPLT
jgi:hypothetical protein